jgi:murein DD-endopeptidase MepM/ murein hydrolase activator NlpD
VRKGQFVDRGQKIATVGSSGRASGPHLHFEIRRRESPRDPMLYLP